MLPTRAHKYLVVLNMYKFSLFFTMLHTQFGHETLTLSFIDTLKVTVFSFNSLFRLLIF